MIGWVEQATPKLPAHERKRGARIRPMQQSSTWRWCVGRPKQVKPAVGHVADPRDALGCDRRGGDAAWRLSERLDVTAPVTHRESMASPAREVDQVYTPSAPTAERVGDQVLEPAGRTRSS
jgi:hypothetical protein